MYYSAEANYSLTLRSTVASCMLRVTADNVYIVNVTAAGATRRRLQASPSSAPTSSSGILAAYLVVVASHYDQSALQSQLTSATSNGFFNQQLTVFAEQFGAAGFVNATSAALVIATASPSATPIAAPTASPISVFSSSWLTISVLVAIIVGSIATCMMLICVVYFGCCGPQTAIDCSYLPCFRRRRLRSPPKKLQPDRYQSNKHQKVETYGQRLAISRSHSAEMKITEGEVNTRRPTRPNSNAISGVESGIYPRRNADIEFVNPTYDRKMSPNRREAAKKHSPPSSPLDSELRRQKGGDARQKSLSRKESPSRRQLTDVNAEAKLRFEAL